MKIIIDLKELSIQDIISPKTGNPVAALELLKMIDEIIEKSSTDIEIKHDENKNIIISNNK